MSEAGATLGRGFGHGKIVLVGEHAVVYGHPAIAAGISAGVTVTARAGSGRISVPAWGLQATADDGSEVGRASVARWAGQLGSDGGGRGARGCRGRWTSRG